MVSSPVETAQIAKDTTETPNDNRAPPLNEPLTEEATREIFDRIDALLKREISEELIAEVIDLLYRLYRGYPFTGAVVLGHSDRVSSVYKQSIDAINLLNDKLMTVINQYPDKFLVKDRERMIYMMEQVYIYQRYFTECLAGWRNLVSITEISDEVVGKFNKGHNLSKRFWNAFASLAEKIVRSVYGLSHGEKIAVNMLSQHAENISALGNQICLWANSKYYSNYPVVSNGMSADDILLLF